MMNKIRIAVLYICTGKYNQFFKGFYESCEKHFLANKAEKDYFVFTDDMKLCKEPNVQLFYKECKGFPMDSLLRFDLFLSIRDLLEKYDYIFFFNANMKFLVDVGEEFLPKSEGLAAVVHPWAYNKPACLFPYDRNRNSTAFIKRTKKTYRYYMGSLNGGKAKDYLQLAETCSRNIHADMDNHYIALYHDESHLNKYLSEHECLSLSPSYAYPEGKVMPFDAIILIRDKVKIDKYFDKGRNHSLFGQITTGFKILYRAICWFI